MPFHRGSRSLMVSAQANHRRHGRARSQVFLATDGNSSRPKLWKSCFFIHGVAPRLTDTQQALVRSQCGPLAAIPFTCCPTSLTDPFRRARFPGVSSPPPLAPSPSVLVRLPVWPSTRHLWPPPICARSFIGARFCVGERGGSGVQRGGGPCLIERAGW